MSIKPKKFKKITLNQIKLKIECYINCGDLPSINGFTSAIILKHINVLTELIYFYLYDETQRPLSVAYSGGKDSSVTVDITIKALLLIKHIYGAQYLNKKTYVILSDTYMELDPVIYGILTSLKEIKKFCHIHKLNVQVEKVSPRVKHRFWSLVIGKGYILANKNNRYCTDRLKVIPQNKKINEILKENNQGYIAVTGQRQDESNDRKKRLQVHTIDGSLKDHDYKGCSLYVPIEHWNSNDVWNYIYSSTFDFIDEHFLGKIYAEASGDGDECKSLLVGYEATAPGCGKSGRFGCWVCPLHFNKDKTLQNLGNKYSYLQKMEKFRNWLVDDATGQWNWKRDVFIHGKHKMKKYDRKNHRKNMQLPGGYTLTYRKEILRKLMQLELEVLEDRNGEYLITDEELSYIQQIWIEDGDVDMSVVGICKHRNIRIDPLFKQVVKSASIMRDITHSHVHYGELINLDTWYEIQGLRGRACDRYYTQMALQIEKAGYSSEVVIESLRYGKPSVVKTMVNYIKTLPLETKMDFVCNVKEKYIRQEWKHDEIGFITFLELLNKKEIEKPQKNLFGYDGVYGKHFDALDELNRVKDITKVSNDLISLEDKMRWFDNW